MDKTVLRDCKRRSTNPGMAWIDYRKAYDMIHVAGLVNALKFLE